MNKIIDHHWRCFGGCTSGVRNGHANDRDSSQNSSIEVLSQCDGIWRALGRQLGVAEVMRSATRLGSVLLVKKEETAETLLSAWEDTPRRQLSAIWELGPHQGQDHAGPGLAAPRTVRYTLLLLKRPSFVLEWKNQTNAWDELSAPVFSKVKKNVDCAWLQDWIFIQ